MPPIQFFGTKSCIVLIASTFVNPFLQKIRVVITRIRYDLRGISGAPIKVRYGDDGEETEEGE